MTQNKGLRYNKEKDSRPSLLPAWAMNEVSKIFTFGAHKYSVFIDDHGVEHLGKDITPKEAAGMKVLRSGDNNWRLGLSWMKTVDSMERHISDYKKGLDYDPEDGQLLISKVATNALFLTEYYHIYPQGDDRPHQYLNIPKIGLDIDDVICDFIPAFAEKFGLSTPTDWHWSYEKKDFFEVLFSDPLSLANFYSTIPPKITPEEIPFYPACYITNRSIPTTITQAWIEGNGFPCAPVISVGHGQKKSDAAKEAGIDVFVEDCYDNFVELNNAGICCYLLDAPHNRKYDVGHKRISSLKDLPWFRAF